MGSYQSQKMWDLSQDLALSKQQSNVLPQKLQIPHCKQNRSKYPHPCGKCHTLFSFLSHFLYASLYLLYTYHIHVTLNLGLSLEGHVKEHTVVLVVWDRYCEVSLQLGLVKTWECSPCISWLKMGGRESPDNIKWYRWGSCCKLFFTFHFHPDPCRSRDRTLQATWTVDIRILASLKMKFQVSLTCQFLGRLVLSQEAQVSSESLAFHWSSCWWCWSHSYEIQ